MEFICYPAKATDFFLLLVVTYLVPLRLKLLRTLYFRVVADFFWENVIYHYGYFEKLIIDEGSENNDVVAELAKRYEIKRIVVFVYHP